MLPAVRHLRAMHLARYERAAQGLQLRDGADPTRPIPQAVGIFYDEETSVIHAHGPIEEIRRQYQARLFHLGATPAVLGMAVLELPVQSIDDPLLAEINHALSQTGSIDRLIRHLRRRA